MPSRCKYSAPKQSNTHSLTLEKLCSFTVQVNFIAQHSIKKYVVLTHLQVFGNFSVLVLLEIWNLNHQITFKLPFSFPARSQPCCGSSCSFFFFLSFFLTFIFLLFLLILLTVLLLCFFDLFIWGKDDKVLQELLVKYIKGLSDGAIESLKHSSTANNLISYHRVSFTLTATACWLYFNHILPESSVAAAFDGRPLRPVRFGVVSWSSCCCSSPPLEEFKKVSEHTLGTVTEVKSPYTNISLIIKSKVCRYIIFKHTSCVFFSLQLCSFTSSWASDWLAEGEQPEKNK